MKVHQPSLPSGFATFCDDVRYETNGKFSLIGVYSGEMSVFGTAPATIPMVWAAVRWRMSPNTKATNIVIRLSKDTEDEHVGEILNEATIPINLPDQGNLSAEERSQDQNYKMTELFTHLRVSPLVVDGPFKLRVRVIFEGEEYRIGAMAVGFADPATLQ